VVEHLASVKPQVQTQYHQKKKKKKKQDTTIHLLEWPKSKTLARIWRKEKELSFIADGNTKSYSSFGDSLEISYKTKYNLSYTPAIIIPVIYPKELEIYIHIICLLHTCTFLSTLFITAKTWKQPRWP
jgi:hypothetical protein